MVNENSRPISGIIYDNAAVDTVFSPSQDVHYNMVDVYNITPAAARIVHNQPFEAGSSLGFMVYDEKNEEWKTYRARVTEADSSPDNTGSYSCGIEFIDDEETGKSDLEFLINTELFETIHQDTLFYLINCLTRIELAAGKTLFSQGNPGEALYLIQKGTCAYMIEKDGQTYQASQLKPEDVCGTMSVLTGEPTRGSVIAESNAVLWRLSRDDFESLSQEHEDLRLFLTELVTHSLTSWSQDSDRVVGKYTIKNRVGTGGWGIVYDGYHTALKIPVAIKMLKHDMAMTPLFIDTFRREANTIARLNHPSIVQVYDIDEIYRTIFITMEFLEGDPLRSVLNRRGKITVTESVNYLIQILNGLEYAHSQGIIHRDIKPGNIFVMQDGGIKILDFGLALASGEEDLSLKSTIFYAPPEQIEGRPEDVRSDLYAVGIMTYELLCGKRPYPEDDPGYMMELHCKQEIPDPAETIPDIPEELRQFIIKCCYIDPDRRYQSAREALADLEQLSRSLSIEEHKEKQFLTSVFMFYPEKHRQSLTGLLEEFTNKAREIGINVKVNETMEI